MGLRPRRLPAPPPFSQYAELSGVPQFKGLVWAMLPNFLSATCAFTW